MLAPRREEINNRLTAFATNEGGAAATDWIVMTSATVGIALAATFVASRGTQDRSEDVAGSLQDVADTVGSAFEGVGTLLASIGFDEGRGAWSGGEVRNVPGFGNMLVLDRSDNRGGIGTEATFQIDPEAPYTVVEFDMAFVDSWDNETATVYLNGEAVALGRFTHRDHPRHRNGDVPPQMQDLGVTSVQFGEPSSSRGGYFERSNMPDLVDYTQPVRIVMETNGASDMDLGFGTSLNSNHRDESLGIDNIAVSSAQSP